VQVFPGPPVGHMEIFVHATSLSFLPGAGKHGGHVGGADLSPLLN
jgi:hypothetical protein